MYSALKKQFEIITKMPYQKRQIIETYYDFKDGTKIHPSIILSVPKVYDMEKFYLCVLISKTKRRDNFTFPLKRTDTLLPLFTGFCVRTHLIYPVFDNDINSDIPRNFVKVDVFDRLIDFIAEVVFDVAFED